MNHFIAVRPDVDSRDRLAVIAERLRQWELPARWVHPEDYHITVHFLGAVGGQEAHAATWAAQDALRSWLPGRLTLDGLGAFGGRTEPRIVFAAVGDPDGWLNDLHADVHAALGEPVPEWRPHITLCRPRSGAPVEGRTWPRLFEAFGAALWGECVVDELGLYRTRDGHSGEGPRYELVERF